MKCEKSKSRKDRKAKHWIQMKPWLENAQRQQFLVLTVIYQFHVLCVKPLKCDSFITA